MPLSPCPKGRLLAIGGHEQRQAPGQADSSHDCTGNTIYEIEPGEVFSIRDLHLLAKGQRYTLPGFLNNKAASAKAPAD